MMKRSIGSRVRSLVSLVAGFTHRTERESRLAEEMRFHVDMQTEKYIARGMAPDEARRAATVHFGGRERWREASRDEYRSRRLDDLAQDLRYALRTLSAAPAFTIAAVLTLAIGIGGTTAIFSAVDGVLLKPLPFTQADRIVRLYQNDRKKKRDRDDVAPGNFAEWRARSSAFAAMAAVEPYGLVYSGPEGEEQIRNWNVTQDFFTVLDAKPLLGRVFQASDYVPGNVSVLVVTYASWQKRFGGDPAIVGKRITIEHAPATIIGVLPRDFSYLGSRMPQEMYAPKVLDSIETALRGNGWYHAVARLKPGVTIDQAGADVNRGAAQLAREYPKTNGDLGVTVASLRDAVVGDTARALLLLLGAVGFVLLIACTNVASLMLARTNRRGREFAIRVALGACAGRIVRRVLTESFLIAVAGGLAGSALAHWGVGAIRALSPASIPRVDEMRVDLRALGFALAAAVATTFLFGLIPALRAAAPSSADELKAGGRAVGVSGQRRARGALVSAEVALAVVLLVAAGLLIRSFVSVKQLDRGYRSDHVLGATLFIWSANPTAAMRRQFAQRLVARAAAMPGVTNAGVTSSPPLAGAIGLEKGPYTIVGNPVTQAQAPIAHLTSLTPGAFDVLHMVAQRGRLFTAQDDSGSIPVAIVNETMARREWPNENPIGKRLRTGYYGGPIEREVVGVVADTRQTALDAPPLPTIYMPHAQTPTGAIWLVVRTSIEPAALSRDVKRLVTELSPTLPVASIQTFDELVSDSLKPRRFTLVLFASFSLAALVLAVIGVYGVISQATAERVKEFGVRIALGAQPSDIIRMVMWQGLGAAGVGVVLGVLGAMLLTRLLSNMLFGVTSLDVVTFGSVSVLMLGTALAACYIPARRATKVDPLMALRAG